MFMCLVDCLLSLTLTFFERCSIYVNIFLMNESNLVTFLAQNPTLKTFELEVVRLVRMLLRLQP